MHNELSKKLHAACVSDDSVNITTLLAQGADPLWSNGAPIIAACQNGNLAILQAMIDSLDHCTSQKIPSHILKRAMEFAAMQGHLPVIKYICENGGYGGTALMRAAENGHLDSVSYLLKHQRIEKADRQEALHLALSQNRYEILPILLAAGGWRANLLPFFLSLPTERLKQAVNRQLLIDQPQEFARLRKDLLACIKQNKQRGGMGQKSAQALCNHMDFLIFEATKKTKKIKLRPLCQPQ